MFSLFRFDFIGFMTFIEKQVSECSHRFVERQRFLCSHQQEIAEKRCFEKFRQPGSRYREE